MPPGDRGAFRVSGGGRMQITRPDGLITREQAAALCDVTPQCITNWSTIGYRLRDSKETAVLPVAKREGRAPLYRPVDVAKAEYATRKRARRPSAVTLAQVA